MEINKKCVEMMEIVNKEITEQGLKYKGKLRSCSASVWETNRFVILKSYYTNVAFIDKNSDTLYDVLRYVYGYTATSSQHIAKFNHDYGYGMWGCNDRLTYR